MLSTILMWTVFPVLFFSKELASVGTEMSSGFLNFFVFELLRNPFEIKKYNEKFYGADVLLR